MKRAWIFLGVVAGSPFLHSNPSQSTVMAGNVALDLAGSELQIRADDRSIIHWQDFSIDVNEVTKFILPNDQAYVLNRVLGANSSQILGSLLSNGQVIVVNPQGIYIGNDAVVDTAGFIASTLDLRNEDFCKGKEFNFQGDSENSVVNLGTVRSSNGDAILIGYQVKNEGSINAPQGVAGLAAGMDVIIRPLAEDHIFIRTKVASATETGIEHSGLLEGLQAEIKADGYLYQYAVKFNGKVNANRMVHEQGRVFLVAAGGNIDFKGEILADSGLVKIDGERVYMDNGSLIDVSGDSGGGSVWVEANDWIGVESEARIAADARVMGNGGSVIVNSPNYAAYRGALTALGGSEGGDGGFLEVSGHRSVDIEGIKACSMAPNGKVGRFLLDPCDLTITAAGNSAVTPLNLIPPPNPPWTGMNLMPDGTASPCNVKASDIVATLNGNFLAIDTVSSVCTPSAPGGITLSTTLDWSGNANTNGLLLQASGIIIIASPIITNGNISIETDTGIGASISVNQSITSHKGFIRVQCNGPGSPGIFTDVASVMIANDGGEIELTSGAGTVSVAGTLTTNGGGPINIGGMLGTDFSAAATSSGTIQIFDNTSLNIQVTAPIQATGDILIGNLTPDEGIPNITIAGTVTSTGGSVTVVGSTGLMDITAAISANDVVTPEIDLFSIGGGDIKSTVSLTGNGGGGVTIQTQAGGDITNTGTINALLNGPVNMTTMMGGNISNSGIIGGTDCGALVMDTQMGGTISNTAEITIGAGGGSAQMTTTAPGGITNSAPINVTSGGFFQATTFGTPGDIIINPGGFIGCSGGAGNLGIATNGGSIAINADLTVISTGKMTVDSSGMSGGGSILLSGGTSTAFAGATLFHSDTGTISIENSISSTTGSIMVQSDGGSIAVTGGQVFSSSSGAVTLMALNNIGVTATSTTDSEVFTYPTGTVTVTSTEGSITVQGLSGHHAIIGRTLDSLIILPATNPSLTFKINAVDLANGGLTIEGGSGTNSYGLIGLLGSSAATTVTTLSANFKVEVGNQVQITGGSGTGAFAAMGVLPNQVSNTILALELDMNATNVSPNANISLKGGSATNAFALIGGGGLGSNGTVTFSPFTAGSSFITLLVENISSTLFIQGGSGTDAGATIGFIVPGALGTISFTETPEILVSGLMNTTAIGNWTIQGGSINGVNGLIGFDLSTKANVTLPSASIIGLFPFRSGLNLLGDTAGAAEIGVFSNADPSSSTLSAAIGIDATDPTTMIAGSVAITGNAIIQDYYAGSFTGATGIASQLDTSLTTNAFGTATIMSGGIAEILAGTNISIQGGSLISAAQFVTLAVDENTPAPFIGPGAFIFDPSALISTGGIPIRVYTARFTQNIIVGTLNGATFSGTRFVNDPQNQYDVFLSNIFPPYTGTASLPFTIFYKEGTKTLPIGNTTFQTVVVSEFNLFQPTFPFSGVQADDLFWDPPYWVHYNRRSVNNFDWRKGTLSSFQQVEDDNYFIFRKKYIYYRGY